MSSDSAKPPKIIRSGVIPTFEKGHGSQPLFSPSQWPIGLLFLQNCWNRLRHKQAVKENFTLFGEVQCGDDSEDETLLVSDFQRVMVRLLSYLGYDHNDLDTQKYVIEGTKKVDWRSFCDCWNDLKINTTFSTTERIYLGFDPAGAASCKFGQFVSSVVFFTIIASSISFISSTLQGDLWQVQDCPDCQPKPRPIFATIEDICAVIFTTEFLSKLLLCCTVRLELLSEEDLIEELCSEEPVQWLGPLGRLKKFWTEKSNIIDFLAILPYYFEKFVDAKANLMVLRLVRLTRMFRILRLGKLSDAMDTLVDTFDASLPSLYVLSFYICLFILVSSSIVYYSEAGSWDEENQAYFVVEALTGEKVQTSFVSIPDTFWWNIVTVTTVGFGDLYPNTAIGKFFGSITIVVGVCAFAMPVAVICSNFSHVWKQHQKALEASEHNGLTLADSESKTIEDGFEHVGLKRCELRFQVFHVEPPSEPVFIGAATLDLAEVPWDAFQKSGVAMSMKLEGDLDKTRKGVSGFLDVNLLWEPGTGLVSTLEDQKELYQYARNFGDLPQVGSQAQKKKNALEFSKVVKDFWSRPPTPYLIGNLTVEVLSARGLNGTNPRVEVQLYPGLRRDVQPYQWTTRAVEGTCDPDFGEIRSFTIDWSLAKNPPPRESQKRSSKNFVRRSQMNIETPTAKELELLATTADEDEDQEDTTPLGKLLPHGDAQTIADQIIEELEKKIRCLQTLR